MKVVDTTVGCGVDIRHGGVGQPGIGSIMGRNMPLLAMSQVPLNPALGVSIIPLTNNGLSVEVNWNGTLIQVVMGDRLLQVHSSMIQQCQGLCGSCSGSQQLPSMDPTTVSNYIAQYAVQPNAAIQPDQACSSASFSGRLLSGSSPQLFLQTSTQSDQYPVPAYRAPSINDALYQAQFESQQVLMQVFQQCSDNDQQRLQVDPWFNSFVEDCMYDKSLGPGYESAAKASMDAYITWTESLLRWTRLTAALRQAPVLQVCAACIPVTWTDPVQTNLILTPTVTQRRGSLGFPLRYSGTASQYLVPGRFVQSYVGQDFLNSAWNSPITLSPLSQLNMLPLPQQLISSPIVVGPNSNDLASQQVSFNPIPTMSSGTCSVFDQQSMMAYEQVVAQYISNGQLSQLLQLIQQGQYPYLACALTCLAGAMSSTFSSMSSLASSIQMSQAAMLCPSQQYLNGFGNGFQNGIFPSSSPFNSLNGLGGLNNGVNMFNGLNAQNLLSPFGNLNGISPFNGVNGINNMLPANQPLNVINGLNGGFNPALNNMNGLGGIQSLNGLNPLMNNFNGMNGMNGLNSGSNLNGLNTLNGLPNNFNGLNNVNGINNLNPINNLNGINGLNNLNGINGLNNLNGINGLNNLNGITGLNSLNGINGLNPANSLNGMNGLGPINNLNGMAPINNINNGINGVNNQLPGSQQPNQVLGPNSVASSFVF